MQGETGSLRDLKRYHLGQRQVIVEEPEPETGLTDVAVNNLESAEAPAAETSASEAPEGGPDSEHKARLREFQVKLLASSNTAYSGRSKSGRRHTLCLTR